jgi:hypothetical protein
MGISRHIGKPGGEVHLLGFRETVKVGSGNTASLYGGPARGTWRKGSFTGDPEGYVKEGSGMGVHLHRGPNGGPGRDTVLCGTLRER